MKRGYAAQFDKGFYHQARKQNTSPLALMTDMVRPEPAEEAAYIQRLAVKLKDPSGHSADPQKLAADAGMFIGLEKVMQVEGIRGSDTIEAAFFSSTNQSATSGLFPAFLASRLIAGIMETSLVPRLIAATVPVNAHVVEKIRYTSTAGQKRLGAIGEGVELPKTTISYTAESIKLAKYGRMLETTYEVMRLMVLDIVSLHLFQMGLQIGIDQTNHLIEILCNGDGTANSTCEALAAEVTGTLDFDETVRLLLSFTTGYQFSDAIINDTHLRTLLNLAEIKDPLAFRMLADGIMPMLFGAKWHRWSDTGSTSFSTTKVIGIDRRLAAVMFREGDLLEESDQLIDRQVHRRTMSEWLGFQTWDMPGAGTVLTIG